MPGSYAHFRFGKQVLETHPETLRRSIARFRRLYDVGQQGPDIFYYYNPLFHTEVGELGTTFHHQTGQEFFTRVCAVAKSEAAKVYVYGLLGHYCLDIASHPYIERLVNGGETRHIALESEFDRYLLALDNLPPDFDYTPHMVLTKGECATVSECFAPATISQIHAGVSRMGKATRFLAGKNREKTEKILRRINPLLLDHLIPLEPVTGMERMDSELLVRNRWAQEAYPKLLAQLGEHMTTGLPLGEDFAKPFAGIAE